MRVIILLAIVMIAMGIMYPSGSQAQYRGFVPWWAFQSLPPYPLWGSGPLFPPPLQTALGAPFVMPPRPFSIPVQPGLRTARTAVTVSIPPLTSTAAPLTSILNLIDSSLLAGGIAVLTTNYPLLYDALVTTFNLPI